MKLSVSVPDEMWATALTARPDLSPSHLVQQALAVWVGGRSKPAFSQDRPPEATVAFAAARDRLSNAAREEFGRGYHAALAAAEVIDLEHFQALVRRQFDVAAWAGGIGQRSVEAGLGRVPKEWAASPVVIRALVEALGSLVSPYGDNEFRPNAPYLRGFSQAMRDLWEQAVEGVSESTTGANDG